MSMTPEQQAAHRAWPAAPMPQQTDREALACTHLRVAIVALERAYRLLGGGSAAQDPEAAGGAPMTLGGGVRPAPSFGAAAQQQEAMRQQQGAVGGAQHSIEAAQRRERDRMQSGTAEPPTRPVNPYDRIPAAIEGRE